MCPRIGLHPAEFLVAAITFVCSWRNIVDYAAGKSAASLKKKNTKFRNCSRPIILGLTSKHKREGV